MQITTLHVAARALNNGMPRSGDVQFDDGKCFIFGWDQVDESYTLSTWVSHGDVKFWRGVHAPKRVAVLADKLNS